MALVQASSAAGGFVELEIGNSVESLVRLLDSQRELFHSQVDQLQKLIVTQCKLTGVNPLSQEMAAGALSIKIGKRPRDLLNPKAIKYMQSVFSIKDTIGKKETREISALCGVTVSQVREYFAGQRSRVRKLVCLPKEKAIRSDASKASNYGTSFNSDQILPTKEPVMNTLELRVAEECTQVTGNSMKHSSSESLQVPESSGDFNTAQVGLQDSVNSTDLKPVQEVPSCSSQDESIPGVDSDDKKFLANIFNLMRKEETFSGQVKLMEWVLQIHNLAVLHWFLTKGGLTILATWLSQAAFEEQTSVLLVFFKVLCHLPLHKALPVQMSAILQTVNRLRFYRISDISNRARILLSRWSKLFVRSQALKKPSLMNSNDADKEMLRRQRISEILSDDSWQSKIDIHEEILALDGTTENSRRSEPRKGQKLLMESRDESKKHGRSVSSPKLKERRKVLLVEQPDRKTTDRNVLVARAVPSNQSRPMSADDIQKAKMRAIFLQDKYGKADASTSENRPLKTEDHKPLHVSQANHRLPVSRISQLHQLRREDHKKSLVPTSETSAHKLETSINSKASSSRGQLWEKVKGNQLPWQAPPEMRVNCLWKVGAGENSKEVEVQTQRNRREKETFYPSAQDIPLNPKEPWDLEMDLDDSLTPEIPTEQPPEADAAAEGSSCSPSGNRGATNDSTTATTSSAPPISNGATEPDLELLAVLLKNPELVIALTSGQGKSLSSQETVALLDTLKKSGAGLAGLMGGVAGGSKEKSAVPDPTSLPSPTPPSEATKNVWRSEFPTPAKVPVLQPHFASGRGSTAHPTAVPHALSAAPVHVAVKSQAPVLGLPPQVPTTVLSMPQLMVSIDAAPQQLPALNFLPKRPPAPMPHQTSAPIHPLQQSPNPPAILPPMQHHTVTNGPALQISLSQREHYSQPALLPTPLRLQPPLLADPHTWLPRAASVGRREPTPDSRIVGEKDLLDYPSHNPHSHTNQLNYNIYHKGSVQPHLVHPGQALGRNGILDGSELETWSPEGSPVRSPEIRSNPNFPEPRRELDWGYRPEWSNSKQWNPGHRDRHQSGGSKRWRDRDRNRDRDRDRDRDGGGRSRRR